MYFETKAWSFIVRQTPEGWDEANGFSSQFSQLAKARQTEDWDSYDELAFELAAARVEAKKSQGYFISLEEWLRAAQEVGALKISSTGRIRARRPDGSIWLNPAEPGVLQAQLDGEWLDAFRYLPDCGVGEFPSRFFVQDHPIGDIAERLASLLKAKITEETIGIVL